MNARVPTPDGAAASAVPDGSKEIGQSAGRALLVYATDTPAVLELSYSKRGQRVMLFRNPRSQEGKSSDPATTP
jgi:hypothetical protein